jgi:hypothetical protein
MSECETFCEMYYAFLIGRTLRMWKMYSHLKTQENKIIESVETPVTNK